MHQSELSSNSLGSNVYNRNPYNLYLEASLILKKMKAKKRSLKSLLYNCKYHNKPQLYALLCKTLKNRLILETVICDCNLLEMETVLDQESAMVLVYELLFGKGKISGGGKKLTAVKKHKEKLFESLKKHTRNLDNEKDFKKDLDRIPRYVRVNTIKVSTDEVISCLQKEGFTLKKFANEITYEQFIALLQNLKNKDFLRDYHIKNLLVFPSHTDFHNHLLYKEGKIILQDKASCLPAEILSPPSESVVLDACAAPGNKTSHLVAIMQNTGLVLANDKDQSRCSLMKNFLNLVGASSVKASTLDFTSIKPMDKPYSQVTHILLDPSCSGSGIIDRKDNLLDAETISERRLNGLSRFQIILLKHALTFPAVQRIVYSTCSVHVEENEDVIEHVLNSLPSYFHLANIIPKWTHRGLEQFKFAKKCIRSSPDVDLTNGFFVAMIERIDTVVQQKKNRKRKMRKTLKSKIKRKKNILLK